MAVVQGRDFFIYQGDSGSTPIVAGARSCTVSMQCDLIEKASATNQTSKEYTPGRTDWEIQLSHLIIANAEFEGMLKVGTVVQLSVVINGVRKVGTAICNYADLGGTIGNLATGSVKFKGSGPLT